MVIGVPNVGKSSLINALRGTHLRKRHSLIVAPYAGVTKSVHERIRVSASPAVYLLDTPGIMNPNIDSMDTGMRLASCGQFDLFWNNLESKVTVKLSDHFVNPYLKLLQQHLRIIWLAKKLLLIFYYICWIKIKNLDMYQPLDWKTQLIVFMSWWYILRCSVTSD